VSAAEVRELFEFNAWAQRRIFDALAALPAEQYFRDLKSSHGGVHGTLCHLVWAEQLWLTRWLRRPPPAVAQGKDLTSLAERPDRHAAAAAGRTAAEHAPVGGWYDCGKVDTLLETNQHLLEHGRARAPSGPCPRCTIVPPVYVEEGVTMHDATIGPNVSIETGSFVAESTIANSILGRNVRVVRGTVKDSLVGDDQKIEGKTVQQSVMDAGEVAPAK
jgi:DinB family